MLRKVKGATIRTSTEIRRQIAALEAEDEAIGAEIHSLVPETKKNIFGVERAPKLTEEIRARILELTMRGVEIEEKIAFRRSLLDEKPFSVAFYIPVSRGDDEFFTYGFSEDPDDGLVPFVVAMRVREVDGVHYYAYGMDIYACDTELASEDATALLQAEELKQRQVIDQARTLVALNGQVQAGDRSTIPPAVRHLVMQRDGGTCVQCGARGDLQFDHIIPVAMGGGSDPANLQILCGGCNRRKGATLG